MEIPKLTTLSQPTGTKIEGEKRMEANKYTTGLENFEFKKSKALFRH